LPADTALSPDGERVVIGNFDEDVARVYDVATGEEILVLPGHRDSVNAVSWSPDGRWIATASRDPFVRVWNAETGELEARLSGHTGEVITVDWGPDSRRLVSGGFDGTARVWEVDEVEGREVFTLAAQQTQAATFAAFSPDGEQVLTGDVGIGAVQIWDLSLQGDAEVMNLPTDRLAPVDVDTLPDGRIVASDRDGSVSVWRTDGTHEVTIGPGGGSNAPVWRIAASPEGGRIATVRKSSGVVSAWDVGTGDRVFEVDTYPSGEVSSIDWAPDGRHLAAGNLFDGRVTIFGADGERLTVLEEPATNYLPSIEVLAFSPGGRTLAVAATNLQEPGRSHVSIWDWDRGEVEQTIDTAWTTALAFDPIGSTFAAGLFDGNVEIRDVATGELVRGFKAHSGRVDDLAFSPDGTWIATAGEDGTVALFDAASGARRFVLPGHGFLVSGLAISPDGRRLITTAPDGVVREWTLDLDELIRIAEGEVTRELTDDECRQYLHLPEGCP
jgi:WD40 repeat protein